MPAITLESIQAKQSELAEMIQQLCQQAQQTTQIEIEGCTITLKAGERYAGARLDSEGNHLHHTIVLADRPDDRQDWQTAQKWGNQCGGHVASPEEYALVKANCPDLLTESWYWTNQEHEGDASAAWLFTSYGITGSTRKSALGGALSVRRV